MASCYECGVTTNEVIRRQVETGHSRGRHGTRTYYSKKSLCSACAKWHDTKTTIKAIIFIVFLLLFFVGSRNADHEPAPTSSKEKSQKMKEPEANVKNSISARSRVPQGQR